MAWERPEELNGKIIKRKMPCGSLWVIVGLDDKGRPREVFLEGSKAGTCRANLEGEARLASKALTRGEWEDVVDAWKGIRCPACMRSIGMKVAGDEKEEVVKHPWSCPDCAAKIIEKIIEERKEKK